jgi:hypothetical protein
MLVAGLAAFGLLALSFPTAPGNAPFVDPEVAAGLGAWTVYHHDDAHTGYDGSFGSTVTSVSTGWVSPVLDEHVYAGPLIYNGLVYAATLNNSVYALNQSTGAVVWHQTLGTPVMETNPPNPAPWACGNVSPQGILGTPVIDATGGRIYLVTLTSDDLYRLVGLDLATGTPVMSTVITTNTPGFDWTIQQQRGALGLAVSRSYVYVPFGGRAGDCGTYHGWVYAVPTDGTAVTHWYQTPGSGAGFWASGGVTVDDATGNIFVTSGNGTGSGCASNPDGTPTYENDAVVRLSPTLAHLDAFVPQDWQANWCGNDEDLGSAGPTLLSANRLFQAGKWGGGFILDPNNLGGMDGQLFPTPKPAPYSQAEACFGNHHDATFGSFAYAAPFVYVECENQGLVALNVNTSVPSFSQCDASCAAPDWHAGGSATFGPPIVAGGAVWAASSGGGLYAFNATTGAQIFHSASFGINRFVTPAEAGGQVFVPSDTVIRSFNIDFSITWNSLGGTWTSGPDVASWSPGRLDIFVRGADNALWHRSWNGSAWSAWESLGGVLTSDPGVVSWGLNRIDVFVRGTDNGLYHKWWDGSSWFGWEGLGGVLSSGPDVASWSANRLDVFVRGTDNGLYHRWWEGSRWNGWEGLGGVLTSDPGAVSWSPNRVDVFVRGSDNALWHKWYGAGWGSWESLGGVLTSGPDASSCALGHLDVFAGGSASALTRIGYNGTSWVGWQSIGGQWTSDPGAVCQAGSAAADVFERGTDNALWQSSIPGS